MTYMQFICHQLICVLTMSLTKIFVQQDAMADCQTTVKAIYQEKDQISDITSLQNQTSNHKQKDVGNQPKTRSQSATN